jgi:hypothetical protein
VVLAAPTPVDVKEAAPTPSEIEERVSAAVEDGFLARAEDAASKLPPIEGDEEARPALRSSTVPSSRLGRLFHYGCELMPPIFS